MRRVLTRPGFLVVVALSAAFYFQWTKITAGASSAPFPLKSEDAAAQLIDPPLAQFARLAAGDGAAEDQFGASVAVSGDTLVVGARSDDIGGVSNEVVFIGAQPEYVGLDQVNVRLSRALIGRRDVDVALTADGKAANTLRVNIR